MKLVNVCLAFRSAWSTARTTYVFAVIGSIVSVIKGPVLCLA